MTGYHYQGHHRLSTDTTPGIVTQDRAGGVSEQQIPETNNN